MPQPPAGARNLHSGWFLAALVAAVLLAYQPAFTAGFIWDDDAHLTAPTLRSWAGLARIWTEPGATQQYYPLLHSLFWLEHRLWGDHAPAYHLANLALHALAAGLFGLLLRRLAVPGAWLAAALFALHPVHVESVAWISEQKNTLSAVFYLGAALAWLRFDADRRRRYYWLAFVLFVLGLLTKTVVATLPAALLVLCWWRRGRVDWRGDVRPLLPWFLLGVTAGLFTAWVERHLIGAAGAAYELTWLQRALLAGRTVWFYPGKLLWPADLTFIYPRWIIEPARVLHWLPLAGAVAVTGWLWAMRIRTRAPLAVWLLFGGTLFPVLGFLDIYPFIYSFVADHFQYLASLAFFAFVAALVVRLPRLAGNAAAAVLLLTLGTLTWRQSLDYRDAETLYRATLDRNPACWMAWNNLGYLQLTDRARNAEAITSFEQALRFRPDNPEARGNLGLALTQAGRPAEAVPHLQESLRLKPGPYQVHNNLGIALATSGRPAEAVAAFRQAAALNPALPNIEENWAKALLLLGRRDEAAEHFARAESLRRGAPAPAAPR
jgi:Flp pilus assembly protein TadD